MIFFSLEYSSVSISLALLAKLYVDMDQIATKTLSYLGI
ncbi:Uncharacterised protein [Porphyromonas crevioricanis]|uniref:Uncharacterized protein n=1 Tax=Porphyromonas crevioricanis TaxID=393921 RepID=A0A2X4SVP6_9PORP|nr:hypothetical protein PORCAN_2011 [Porphyromonas crevioricanis JCM 13913]SQH73811.1 Uncharacterised protein [Porphyromonas crevioricanis]